MKNQNIEKINKVTKELSDKVPAPILLHEGKEYRNYGYECEMKDSKNKFRFIFTSIKELNGGWQKSNSFRIKTFGEQEKEIKLDVARALLLGSESAEMVGIKNPKWKSKYLSEKKELIKKYL